MWCKIIDDYDKGANIIMLCCGYYLDTKYFKELVSHICVVESVGRLNFGGYLKANGYEHVLVKLFQPDYAEYVYELDK